jgi:hypothetical protein
MRARVRSVRAARWAVLVEGVVEIGVLGSPVVEGLAIDAEGVGDLGVVGAGEHHLQGVSLAEIELDD